MLRTIHVRTVFPSGSRASRTTLFSASGNGDDARSLCFVVRHPTHADPLGRELIAAYTSPSWARATDFSEAVRTCVREVEERTGSAADVALLLVAPPRVAVLTRGHGLFGIDDGDGLRLSAVVAPFVSPLAVFPDGWGWREWSGEPRAGQLFLITFGDELRLLPGADLIELPQLMQRTSRATAAARAARTLSAAGGALIIGRFHHLPSTERAADRSRSRPRGTHAPRHRRPGRRRTAAALLLLGLLAIAVVAIVRPGGSTPMPLARMSSATHWVEQVVSAAWGDHEPGSSRWICKIPASAETRLVPVGDYLVAACRDSALRLVDPVSGMVVRRLRVAGRPGPAAVATGARVLIGTGARALEAIDIDTGRSRWRVDLGCPPGSVRADGALAWVTCGSDLVCVDVDSGRLEWRQRLGRAELTGVDVARGAGVCASASGEVIVFDPADGARRWSKQSGAPLASAPVIDRGFVYTLDRSGAATCYHLRTGAILWRADLGEPIATGPVQDGENLYVATVAGEIVALTASSGRVRWRSSSGNLPLPDLVLDGDRVVAVTDRGSVSAFDCSSGKLVQGERFRNLPRGFLVVSGGRAITLTREGHLEALPWRAQKGSGSRAGASLPSRPGSGWPKSGVREG